MKIAGLQLGMHWRFDDWPDEIHVSHAIMPNVSRSYTNAAALDRACDYIADIVGGCPYSQLDEQPRDCAKDCKSDIADCWRLYFMAEGH